MDRQLTVNELLNICRKYKYILVRDYNNSLVGINSEWALKKIEPSDRLTKCIGFIPCSFMEYITMKAPLI